MNLLSYMAGLIALTVVLVTAVARLNDIGRHQMSKRWHVRRLGFIMVVVGCVTVGAAPLYSGQIGFHWTALTLFWGYALTYFTTPNMPPWWRYITGEYREKKEVVLPKRRITDSPEHEDPLP